MSHVIEVCKIGQGPDSCRYLLSGANGFVCGKIYPVFKEELDKKVTKQRIIAQGDNCEGKQVIPSN